MMDWNTFLQQLDDGRFLAELERLQPPVQRSCLPYLRLLKTSTIHDWARTSRAVQHHAELAASVNRLLLERYLLHLGHRRQPVELIEFWRTAVSGYPALVDLWDGDRLAETLDSALSIPEQETRFAELLVRTAHRMAAESGPAWAIDTLRRLAGQRALPPGGVAANATVRVVFGWERRELGGAAGPPDLRAGLLCTFRLLAESGYDQPVKSPHVFDASFLDALREDVRQRVPRGELWGLDHDWDMLGDGVLTGTSGALALWLAQNLAAGLLPDRRWTLPPWVVVIATLDPAGDGTGGAAGPVGLLREKAEVLVEEGVRMMVVATRDHDSDRVRRQFGLDDVPGAEHLLVIPVQVGRDDVADLAGELKRQRLLWPVRLDAFGGRAVEVTPEEEIDLIDRRQEPHVVVSAAEVEAQLAAADAQRHIVRSATSTTCFTPHPTGRR